MNYSLSKLLACLVFLLNLASAIKISPKAMQALHLASELLERGNISYTYGGHSIGDADFCEACISCIDAKRPKPKKRISSCPSCKKCSIDCSNFIHYVFNRSGLSMPYLTTHSMDSFTDSKLFRTFNLMSVRGGPEKVFPADLLVYRGHVVLVERVHGNGRGDVIHSTSGREVKGGGNGIQRARNVVFATFRGPILKVLRHVHSSGNGRPSMKPVSETIRN